MLKLTCTKTCVSIDEILRALNYACGVSKNLLSEDGILIWLSQVGEWQQRKDLCVYASRE
eukprot:6195891-Pleurochrysis_carterae.AAC.2